MYYAYYDTGIPSISTEDDLQTSPLSDNDHLLWDTHMLPASELDERSLSRVAIICTLVMHDNTRVTTPITKQLLKNRFFRLQVDGGANRSVTNCCDCMHISWYIILHNIGLIGDGII